MDNKSKTREVLTRCLPFWDSLTQQEQEEFIIHCRILEDKKGDIFYDIGRIMPGPKILTKGIGRLFITTESGKEITVVHLLDGQLCLISALSCTRSLPYTFNLEMLASGETYYLPAEYYNKLSEENPAVARYNQEILEKRLMEMVVELSMAAFAPLMYRLRGKLLMYRNLLRSDSLPLTHEMLARDMGASRESVSRALKELQAQGLVDLGRNSIVLKDPKKMQLLQQEEAI